MNKFFEKKNSMNTSRLILFIFLFLLFSQTAFSKWFFEHYSINQGLPNNHIEFLFKDSKGFLWVATNNGLSQYDGFTFRNFFNNPKDSNSLPTNRVTGIAEDKNGLIWVGMWGGVATFDPKTQKFGKRNLKFEKGFDYVIHIFCDSKNRIWICTWLGNYLFSAKGELIKHWQEGKGKNDLPDNRTTCTYEDKKGNIWITG